MNFTPKADRNTVLIFTRNGMGHAPEELQAKLAVKFLTLTYESGDLPSKILFYTEGVKMACEGSPALPALQKLEAEGVELVLCSTCHDFFGLSASVKVGIVGGMTDILEAMQKAPKTISL